MTLARLASDRRLIAVGGTDHHTFLQNLVSNDLDRNGLVYAALLTPQGKYLFDFFIVPGEEGLWLDVKADQAEALLQRLTMYRLRADVALALSSLKVVQVFGPVLDQPLAFADPRDPALGARVYTEHPDPTLADYDLATDADWAALRVAHVIPETGRELIANNSYILEHGFERLNGVDFRKGCYVGQEVTARMKHKTELKKGLVQVAITGTAPPSGTDVTCDGKPAGTLYTSAGDKGLAYLRFDRATGPMQAGDAELTRCG